VSCKLQAASSKQASSSHSHSRQQAAAGPAARSEKPGAAVLATVRPLGPGARGAELGPAGCGPGGPTWPLGRLVRWPVAPTGTGDGSSAPPPYRGLPAGRGLRPRVFSAHRPGPQLQVHAPARAVTARPLAKRFQTGPAFLHMPIFTIWPDLVPIQTDAPAQIRAADRPSGTPAVLPSRYVASVDHTGLLRRSARFSLRGRDHTARAHAATAVPVTAPVSACAASCLRCLPHLRCLRTAALLNGNILTRPTPRASREEKTASPIPAGSYVAVCMPAARKEAN
jgi:hypothetical protein